MTLQKHQLIALTAGQPLPPPIPRKKRDNEEWRIQCAFFSWWEAAAKGLGVWPGLCYHIPNSSFLSGSREERAKRGRWSSMAGVKTGVVDVFLAVPGGEIACDHIRNEALYGKRHGLYIEFKKPSERTKKNGGLSDAQQEFLGYAMARGYSCHVCYSWEEAKAVTLNYLKP